MSSAKKSAGAGASCSHVSTRPCAFFHRAKPATELERSESEVHCGPRCKSQQAQAEAKAEAPTPPLQKEAYKKNNKILKFPLPIPKKSATMVPEFRISHSNMALTHKDDKSCCKENLQQLLMFFA